MSEEQYDNSSRRMFMKSIGLFAAGVVAIGGMANIFQPKVAQAAPAPVIPWPYKILDPEVVRKRAYQNYFTGGCCYASAKALLDTLIEQVGAPWDTIPADMFKYGKGGALSWGTLCGALNGSLYIINLATGNAVDNIGNDLIGWYTTNPFPSTLMDSYAKFKKQRQTVANSPLCHQSVSIWCFTTHNEVNGDEKKDRCAKVAGDTAAKAVALLNSWYSSGAYTSTFQASAEYAGCMTCHTGPTSTYDNEQGKMNCVKCHDDKVDGHY